MDSHGAQNKWLIAAAVMSGGLMAALSSSIVNVGLPNMSGALGASVEEIAWVSTAYILANVIVMPLIALISSRFGRKRFYLFSMALFTVASVFCGIAWDLTSIVIFRIIQGFGGERSFLCRRQSSWRRSLRKNRERPWVSSGWVL